jgi:hypothetical protein
LIELLGHLKVFEVFMVGPDLDGMPSTFEIVPPLFESSDNCKHLSVVNLMILLYRIEGFRYKCDWVPGIIFVRLLREYSTGSNARTISFESKWQVIVREY